MSKTTNARIASKYGRRLLATVSSVALLGGIQNAIAASDADHPQLWIELNVQSDHVNGMGDPYLPPFTSEVIGDGLKSPAFAQDAIPNSFGLGGKLTFQPEGSDWTFSASLLYGRTNSRKSTHEQTNAGHQITVGTVAEYESHSALPSAFRRARFSETAASNSESHAVVDFQVGRDIGVGLFGKGSKSTVDFGVRFAQFSSKRSADINADPDFTFPNHLLTYAKYHHTYSVTSNADRSFHGLGPTLSLNATLPIITTSDDSGLNLDWGVNAAALFGRQKVTGHHETTGGFYKTKVFSHYFKSHIDRSGNPDRARNVVVPNLGGFAGVSFRYYDAKISFGYKGDFFFGAIDRGVDTRKSATLGFFGPYASISIGFHNGP